MIRPRSGHNIIFVGYIIKIRAGFEGNVDFIVKNTLIDEKGNLKLIASDVSRHKFTYKTNDNTIVTTYNPKPLVGNLIEPMICKNRGYRKIT